MLKLFRISQDENENYYTYDSAVVVAETPEEAARTHPRGYGKLEPEGYGTWVGSVDLVSVEYLGEADARLKKGVVVASFNAG